MSALTTAATSLREAMTALREAMTAYAQACAAATDAEWVRQGPPRGWSLAETTDHVATTNEGIHRVVGALRPLVEGEAIVLDDADVNVGMFDGDGAAPGPGPTGTWIDAADAAARFEQSMQALVEWADTDEAQLRAGVFEHPVFGFMDGVQWLLFAAVHTESHRLEITASRPLAGRSDHATAGQQPIGPRVDRVT